MKKNIIIGIILILIIIVGGLFLLLNNKNDGTNNNINILENNNLDDDPNIDYTENVVDNYITSVETIENYSFKQIITIKDENMSTKITKYKLTKNADIEIDIIYIEEDPMFDMKNFVTDLYCGIFQLSFFDPEGVDELNQQIDEWNNSEYVVLDDSPEDQKEENISENVLKGYTISRANIVIFDGNNNKISECIITGKEPTDIKIEKYFE